MDKRIELGESKLVAHAYWREADSAHVVISCDGADMVLISKRDMDSLADWWRLVRPIEPSHRNGR